MGILVLVAPEISSSCRLISCDPKPGRRSTRVEVKLVALLLTARNLFASN